MSASDIRAGLLGYGLGGAVFHAPLIAATPGMRLAAIVTSDPERGRAASQAHPGARILASADALWGVSGELDLVVVATPNRTHVPLAMQALEAGLPVVVDKPLAPTAADARRLIRLAAERGLLLSVFHNRRWDGDFLTVRRLIDQGRLGAVARFESRFERWRPEPKPGWRQDAAPEAAGGVLFDLGSHLVDQALLLFGAVTHVYAELDPRTPGSDVDDDAFVALAHASGVRSHLWMSSAAAQEGPRFRVLGSRAAFTKYGLDPQEAALRDGGSPSRPGWGAEPASAWGVLGAGTALHRVETAPGTYPHFYQGVADALRSGAPPPVDAADAAIVIAVIEAARRSAAARDVIEFRET